MAAEDEGGGVEVASAGMDALALAKKTAMETLLKSVEFLEDREGGEEKKEEGKRKRKKKKKKRKGGGVREEEEEVKVEDEVVVKVKEDDLKEENVKEEVEIEYVPPEDIALDGSVLGEGLEAFQDVFQRFQTRGIDGSSYAEDAGVVTGNREGQEEGDDAVKKEQNKDENDEDKNDEESEEKKLSRRQRKMHERMSVARLKQEAAHPEVVEQWDVTAADPALLVHLKSYRHSVPVPSHWRQKRKYLQNKRGMHKAPFQLPSFIAETGIQTMREAYAEAEESKGLKQKQREKIRPKTGKADIDYQILHNAFFKFQTKPVLTEQGDLYYELRELEVKKKNFKPGVLSENLRAALGISEPDEPPPWLYNMQRYPPPPSYPYLKIPGFNAPIPAGASYGYFPKGWGRPPVDAMNRPLYGDVFGMGWALDQRDAEISLPEHERAVQWGELGEEVESEEEEEEEEEEGEGEENVAGKDVIANASNQDVAAGIESTTSVLPGGLETPADAIELRKGVQQVRPQSLYTVVEEKKANISAGLLGPGHVYDLGGKKKNLTEGVEVNLNPEELEEGLGESMLRKKYDEKKAQEEAKKKGDDVSDIVMEGLARKRKEVDRDREKRAKKARDLKF